MAFNSTLYCKRIDSNKRRCGSLCYVVSSLKENGRRKVNYGDVYIKLSKRYPNGFETERSLHRADRRWTN